MKTNKKVPSTTQLWLLRVTSLIAMAILVYIMLPYLWNKSDLILLGLMILWNYLTTGIPHEYLHKLGYWIVNKKSDVKVIIFTLHKRVEDRSGSWYTKSQMTIVLLMPFIFSIILGIATIFFDSSTLIYKVLHYTMLYNISGMIPGDIKDIINMFFVEEYKHFTKFRYRKGTEFVGK